MTPKKIATELANKFVTKSIFDMSDAALKEKNTGMALSIAKIFLDAPITKGGISSDEITKVFEKNNSI